MPLSPTAVVNLLKRVDRHTSCASYSSPLVGVSTPKLYNLIELYPICIANNQIYLLIAVYVS